MNQTQCIDLPVDFCEDLERCMYEYHTTRDNMVFLLDMNRNDPKFLDSPMFIEYFCDEIRKYSAYSDKKQDLETLYLKDYPINTSWHVNFKTKQLIIGTTVND